MRLITHTYDTYDEAVRAVTALEASGVPHEDISLVSGDEERAVAPTLDAAPVDHGAAAGTGASIGTVLGGGAGLLAGIGALAIPGIGPLVAAGWLIAAVTGAGVGAAAGGLVGSLTGAGVTEADAKTYADHVGRGGTLVTVRASTEMESDVEYVLEHGKVKTHEFAAPLTSAPAVDMMGTAPVAPVGAAADTIKVLKEDLVVGKREVEAGAIKVTSRVVERPVTEQVSLHEERVTIERRPVSYALSGAAAEAFRERTLSATARSEEAVVGKDVRVVEEIGLNKQATDRVETVHDTVRETKVDIDELPGTVRPVGYTDTTKI